MHTFMTSIMWFFTPHPDQGTARKYVFNIMRCCVIMAAEDQNYYGGVQDKSYCGDVQFHNNIAGWGRESPITELIVGAWGIWPLKRASRIVRREILSSTSTQWGNMLAWGENKKARVLQPIGQRNHDPKLLITRDLSAKIALLSGSVCQPSTLGQGELLLKLRKCTKAVVIVSTLLCANK